MENGRWKTENGNQNSDFGLKQYRKFEDLPIWQHSKGLALEIYRMTKDGEIARDFGFRDQLRRCAISISSNLVEGFERGTTKEFIQFLYIAKGSAGELRSLLRLDTELNYFSDVAGKEFLNSVEEISRQLSGLIQTLRSGSYRR